VKDAPATTVPAKTESDAPADGLWRACFHRSPEAQILCRRDGRIVDANQSAQKWFDVPPAAAIGDRLPITDRRFRAYFESELFASRPLNIHSIHLKTKSGTTLTIDLTVHPLDDAHCLVSARDVGERERMESHMRRVMAALECTPDAVFMMDSSFRINFVNPAFHRITGYTIEEVLGQTADFFRDQDETEKTADCRRALEAGHDWSGEMLNVHADGRRYPVAVSAAPVRERNGNLIGYASFERDITENRKIQEQLFQSQKMETVGTLAAGVAHDFNNLLQAIRGNTKLVLADENLTDEARQKLRQVSDAASRAADITRQLLSFSRASDDKTEVIDINQLIEDAGNLARHKLERAIDIEVCPADLPLGVDMNPTHAHQALMNLCVNALDAMGNSGRLVLANAVVTLTETQAREVGVEPGTAFGHCRVEDTGGGIPSELMQKIFDPFFTTKPPGKGTGLGLAIVHKAVSEAHGLLEVDSRPGDGTTFNLYLPLATGPVVAVDETAAPAMQTGSGRVLLVDDEEFVLTFTQHCLEAAGYEVIPAPGPKEAWALLEQMDMPPDLVFTDYNMGKITGLQLIARVAEHFPATKFVLASGYLEEAERLLIEQYGTIILQKPFELEEATQAVATQLQA
jgi:two-component system, cell cycle sensor histidine kinase and response regulator CckA